MIARSKLLGFVSGTALLLCGDAAYAQSAPDIAVLAGPCANCHSDGRTSGKIPPLAGRPAATLAELLKAFKGDTPPPGTTIMNRLAKGYTDEQLEALAKFFAEKK